MYLLAVVPWRAACLFSCTLMLDSAVLLLLGPPQFPFAPFIHFWAPMYGRL